VIEPAKTAFAVVDMQNYFMKPGFQGEVPKARAIVPAVSRLAAAAVGIALANNLGPLPMQVTNFLEDAAQGIAVYSASLSSQPNHAPFQGAATTSVVGAASDVQLTGVAAHIDHSGI
jgi:hypothetical protein